MSLATPFASMIIVSSPLRLKSGSWGDGKMSRRTHCISQLLLCLPFVELLANLATRVAPDPCLHLGGILAGLCDSPSTPTEANATRSLHALLTKVCVHVLKNM